MIEPWTQTCSGASFDLLTPSADDVKIDDVATSLARLNRYNGHTLIGYEARGYSVAQHSVIVSRILEQWRAPLPIVRAGWGHDTPESIYGDIISPVQQALRIQFQTMLGDLAVEIREAWGDVAEIEAITNRILFFAAKNDPLRALKDRIDPVVYGALGLPLEVPAIVKRADLVALACEQKALMAHCPRSWDLPEFADARWIAIVPLDPSAARREFIARMIELDERIAAGGT